MPGDDIKNYIDQSRKLGLSQSQIKTQLLSLGKTEKEISKAFGISNDTELTTLTRMTESHFSLWIAFEYFLMFFCLLISSVGLGIILHHGIDQIIPDVIEKTSSISISSIDKTFITWNTALIIVTYPIFVFLFIHTKKIELSKSSIRRVKSRKILIYLTLVITFLIMIFNVILALFKLLEGSVTSRFIAHALLTLFIVGGIFVYYFFEVKEDARSNE